MSFTDSRPANMRPRPLTELSGTDYPTLSNITGKQVLHYTVTCRDCGDLPSVQMPQSIQQAGLVRQRHLAEHLEALAQEIKEAAR